MPQPHRPRDSRPSSPERKPVAKPAARDNSGGERIAKVLARAGVASRREAEGMIAEGRIAVNGARIDSPALNATAKDRITVDGKPLAAAEPPRLWLYHKPLGLVTSARDEKGRQTVFDTLPEDMPRVMSVGRLDINSEGLLLLTNDGELKRRLELPSTGWLRRYRVRVNGRPEEAMLEPLRKGIVVEGERFQPMIVALDRQQGANAWLTVGIREGKNREVRRAMESVGLAVNRLIRIGYGPFQLGDLAPGAVDEVRPRVLRDQLGLAETPGATERDAAQARGPARGPRAAKTPGESEARPRPAGRTGPAKPAAAKPGPTKPGAGKTATARSGPAKPGGFRPGGSKATADRPETEDGRPARRSWGAKSHGGGKSGGAKSGEGGADGKPRSWGSKSAAPSASAPRKPGGGPKTPR